MNSHLKQTQPALAYRHLRRLLLFGQSPQGKRLTESDWSERLGVTRGALREAMGVLTHEGLLQRGKRGGFFVPQMTPQDVNEILEVRLGIEVTALKLMDEKGGCSPSDLKAMRKVCRTMEQLMSENLSLGFLEADHRFHELLVAGSGNRRLQLIYLQAPLPLAQWNTPSMDQIEAEEQTIRDHCEICDLIEAGRMSDAADCLEKHLLTAHSSRLSVAYT